MKETKQHQMALFAGACALSLIVSGSVLGQPVSPGGAFFIEASPIYRVDPPAPNPVWDVESSLNGGTIKDVGSGNLWQILTGGATFTWTGNPLVADTSTGGWASATFGGGGTLRIEGQLMTVAPFPQTPVLVFDGLLLEATVSGFDLRETDPSSNVIHSINQTITFTPTGGYLHTNGTLRLDGVYEFALVGAVTGPVQGGPLDDFSVDLASLNAFQINFNLVPEPASLLLLSAGAVLLTCRRRSQAGA